MKHYTAVSLFAGAGGLDMGFSKEGFDVLWANDFDKDACATYRLWSPKTKVICGDISKVDYSQIPGSDIILGGFPCQGFSLSGPRKIDDSRNVLYKHYVKLVRQNQPLMFIGENVKGLLTMGGGEIVQAIIADFASCGYRMFYKLLNAKDFGVPQDRQRLIIVGIRNDLPFDQFAYPVYRGRKHTLRDALSVLGEIKPSDICRAPFSSRYMSRNRLKSWDDVSFTIPAMAKQVPLWPGSPKMEKLGKDLWKFGTPGETRRLSWQEAAAVQTFPKDMKFEGNLTSVYKQIGNAVPVQLAREVAKAVYASLSLLERNDHN